MKTAILVTLALCATQAAAQSSAPQPTQTPPAEQKAPAERRPLNLKLDEPASRYVRETQPDAKGGDNLPTLGGATTSFERQPRDLRPDARGRYPMDVENGNR